MKLFYFKMNFENTLEISFAKLEKWDQVYFMKMIYTQFKKFI